MQARFSLPISRTSAKWLSISSLDGCGAISPGYEFPPPTCTRVAHPESDDDWDLKKDR
jgi:hypothetical protein